MSSEIWNGPGMAEMRARTIGFGFGEHRDFKRWQKQVKRERKELMDYVALLPPTRVVDYR